MYTRTDNSSIGYTLPNGLFHFPMFWFVRTDWASTHKVGGDYNQLSGMDRDFTTRTNQVSKHKPPVARPHYSLLVTRYSLLVTRARYVVECWQRNLVT